MHDWSGTGLKTSEQSSGGKDESSVKNLV